MVFGICTRRCDEEELEAFDVSLPRIPVPIQDGVGEVEIGGEMLLPAHPLADLPPLVGDLDLMDKIGRMLGRVVLASEPKSAYIGPLRI